LVRGVVGRGDEVEAALLLVDVQQLDHVEFARRDELHILAGAGDEIDVSPAVALAQPGEPLAAGQPVEFVVDVDPGVVALGEDRLHLAGPGIGEHHAVGVLEPVELLEHDLVGLLDPVHAGDVVFARIAGNVEPPRTAAVELDHAHPADRVPLPDLRILERDDVGVEGVGVVNHGELADAA